MLIIKLLLINHHYEPFKVINFINIFLFIYLLNNILNMGIFHYIFFLRLY